MRCATDVFFTAFAQMVVADPQKDVQLMCYHPNGCATACEYFPEKCFEAFDGITVHLHLFGGIQ